MTTNEGAHRRCDLGVVIQPSELLKKGRSIELKVVRVWELQPPEGEPSVEWVLLTTETIDTVADLATVVDCYRSRWVIEEFLEALKQGCSLEKRQLRSGPAGRV